MTNLRRLHGVIWRTAGRLGRAGRTIVRERRVPCGLAVGAIIVITLDLPTPAPRPALADPTPAAPSPAQAGPSCPLAIGDQVKAVKAFAEMLPIFRHPRCLNCHGGVDPLSAKHRGVDQLDPAISRLTDRQKYEEQCQACHDGLPGWTIPGEPVFFVGKGDEEMCLQMKRFERTADLFVSHIHDDHQGIQFIEAGFAGDRALGDGLKDYGLVVEKPPGTHEGLTTMAKNWVAAMGGQYVGSPECGCVMPTIRLEVHHRSTYMTNQPSFLSGQVGFEGEADFEVKLALMHAAGGRYRGDTSFVRAMKAQYAAKDCKGTATQRENWWFNATVDQASQTMKLQFGFAATDRQGSGECIRGGHVIRSTLVPRLVHDLNEIVMSADNGATMEVTQKDVTLRAEERMVVKVVAVPLK